MGRGALSAKAITYIHLQKGVIAMRQLQRKNIKKALQDVFPVELKQYRKRQNLSQEAMARTLMLSVRSYIDLEHGLTMPSALTLALYMMLLSKEEQKDLLSLMQEAMESTP